MGADTTKAGGAWRPANRRRMVAKLTPQRQTAEWAWLRGFGGLRLRGSWLSDQDVFIAFTPYRVGRNRSTVRLARRRCGSSGRAGSNEGDDGGRGDGYDRTRRGRRGGGAACARTAPGSRSFATAHPGGTGAGARAGLRDELAHGGHGARALRRARACAGGGQAEPLP